MKFISFVILILMMSYASSRAQDTTSTKLERAGYVVGSSLAFSLIDYVGYSLVRKANYGPGPGWYRLFEGAVQAGVSYFLYKECGLSSAISFNLIWWTWGMDFEWYGWANLLNPASDGERWENRTHNGLQGREISWAGWTPIGLLRPQGSLIARDALITQAIVGFSVSVALLW